MFINAPRYKEHFMSYDPKKAILRFMNRKRIPTAKNPYMRQLPSYQSQKTVQWRVLNLKQQSGSYFKKVETLSDGFAHID